jgi:hypothetical protein
MNEPEIDKLLEKRIKLKRRIRSKIHCVGKTLIDLEKELSEINHQIMELYGDDFSLEEYEKAMRVKKEIEKLGL